jgi:tetrahydromethanopterin S-methyltransferase subunit B
MYRSPGEDDHKNITQVFDEIIIEMRKQNERIQKLEELVEKLYLEID